MVREGSIKAHAAARGCSTGPSGAHQGMTRFRFAQVNVFSADPLGGNPLAVVHAAEGLSDARMAALAVDNGPGWCAVMLKSAASGGGSTRPRRGGRPQAAMGKTRYRQTRWIESHLLRPIRAERVLDAVDVREVETR